MRNLFFEMCRPLKNKTLLISDSTVAIRVTKEQIVSEKNKFVLLAYHYIDELAEDIEIHYLKTSKMLADILTKAGTEGVFNEIVPKLTGVSDSPFSFTPPKPFHNK